MHEEIADALDDLHASMPAGTLLETGGTVEKSAESNAALLAQVPLIALMLTVLMLQLGSFRGWPWSSAWRRSGSSGRRSAAHDRHADGVHRHARDHRPCGMIIRNSVILDQIEHERARGVEPWQAVVDATMHRFRPIMLTAAAILGMIPIMHDVFWVRWPMPSSAGWPSRRR